MLTRKRQSDMVNDREKRQRLAPDAPSPASHLYTNTLQVVFSYLHWCDLTRVVQVSRAWKHALAAFSVDIMRTVDKCDFPYLPLASLTRALQSSSLLHMYLTHVSLDEKHPCDHQDMVLFATCRNIYYMHVSVAPYRERDWAQFALPPNLRTLTVNVLVHALKPNHISVVQLMAWWLNAMTTAVSTLCDVAVTSHEAMREFRFGSRASAETKNVFADVDFAPLLRMAHLTKIYLAVPVTHTALAVLRQIDTLQCLPKLACSTADTLRALVSLPHKLASVVEVCDMLVNSVQDVRLLRTHLPNLTDAKLFVTRTTHEDALRELPPLSVCALWPHDLSSNVPLSYYRALRVDKLAWLGLQNVEMSSATELADFLNTLVHLHTLHILDFADKIRTREVAYYGAAIAVAQQAAEDGVPAAEIVDELIAAVDAAANAGFVAEVEAANVSRHRSYDLSSLALPDLTVLDIFFSDLLEDTLPIPSIDSLWPLTHRPLASVMPNVGITIAGYRNSEETYVNCEYAAPGASSADK